jgi:hypothetical protein
VSTLARPAVDGIAYVILTLGLRGSLIVTLCLGLYIVVAKFDLNFAIQKVAEKQVEQRAIDYAYNLGSQYLWTVSSSTATSAAYRGIPALLNILGR